jgi:hypothetical protein
MLAGGVVNQSPDPGDSIATSPNSDAVVPDDHTLVAETFRKPTGRPVYVTAVPFVVIFRLPPVVKYSPSTGTDKSTESLFEISTAWAGHGYAVTASGRFDRFM